VPNPNGQHHVAAAPPVSPSRAGANVRCDGAEPSKIRFVARKTAWGQRTNPVGGRARTLGKSNSSVRMRGRRNQQQRWSVLLPGRQPRGRLFLTCTKSLFSSSSGATMLVSSYSIARVPCYLSFCDLLLPRAPRFLGSLF
jgi:hypothetical protein